MKLKMNYAETKEGKKALVNVDFIADNEEEKENLDWLRDYFFWGSSERGSFPKYGGRKTDDNGVTNMIRFDIPLNAKRLLVNNELSSVDGMEYPSESTYKINEKNGLLKF